MNRDNPAAKPYYRLMALGLIILSISQLAVYLMNLNHLIAGLGMGVGIGLELGSLYKISRLKKDIK